MGLGSLWVGWFDRKKAFEFLNLKKGENIEIIIAIGEKDEEPNERKKKSFEDIVEFRS
jgi:nitroreductase